jgi:hypothetical protein
MIKDPKFVISEEVFDKCTKFAQDSVESSANKYARRNQWNVAKIMDDIRNGKIAEEMVYQKVSELYPNISKPDFNVYEKKNKSWDPDLTDPAVPVRIAVKSQDIKADLAYGRSWVFQFGNGKVDCDTGIFGEKDDHHYVCFVSLNTPKRIGELRSMVKVSWLHEKELFKPMKLKNLSSKLAVYYDDLEPLADQLWQL